MKKSTIFLALLALVLCATAFGQKASVINSSHDVGSNGCKSCHAPHNGSVALNSGTDQATGKLLLWDRAISTQSFATYDSPTMDNKTAAINGPIASNTEPKMYSLLCMSCHDGVTTTSVIAAGSDAAVGNPTNSHGLSNDHPVNMAYNPANDAGLKATTVSGTKVTVGTLPLYGSTNTVQCATCHDPHDKSGHGGSYLRASNTDSALCVTCHQ